MENNVYSYLKVCSMINFKLSKIISIDETLIYIITILKDTQKVTKELPYKILKHLCK